MQLDDLRAVWARHDEKLDRSIRLDERLLRETTLQKTRFALSCHALLTVLELVTGSVLTILLGSFIAQHIDAPRFVVAAVAVHLFVIGIIASSVYRLVLVRQIDYGGSVTTIQRQIGKLKLVTYRSIKWVLLASVLIWVPIVIVLSKALLDVDLYTYVSPAWVGANLALGVVVIAVGQSLSKRYVERPDMKPWARRLVDNVSGRRLEAVAEFLEDLSRFERDSVPGV